MKVTNMAKEKKYYAVARGRYVGIFSDGGTCLELVSGYKGDKYQKFDTFEDNQDYMTDERNLYIDPWKLDRKIFYCLTIPTKI